MKKSLLYFSCIFLLALIVSFPLIIPYFKTGYFPTHDGEWAVVRLSEMYREVKDLQFPARFSGYLNFQYGYPLFNFAYPIPYYAGLIFVFLKFGFVNSIKILFSLSVVLSFFSMFILSSSLWKNKWAGLLSAIFYLYVPYRIVDLYVRGSLGESLSFALLPLILLGIKRIYEKGKSLDILIVGSLYALLIATHNIMTILFGVFIMFILIVALYKKKFGFVRNILLSMLVSLCFSAFFWIPAIFEKNLILLSKIPIADRSLYFIKPMELIIPKWGYGVPTDVSGFGYQVGLPQLIAYFLALIFALKNLSKNEDAKIAFMLIVFTFLISFLLFSQTSFIWSHVPLLSEINYPWILLAIIMFLLSLIGGYLSKLGKPVLFSGLFLSLLAIVLIIPHAKPQYAINRGDSFYTTNQATTTSSNELMPVWVKKLPLSSPMTKVELSSGQINNIFYNSKKITFDLDLPKPEKIKINTVYYPGWQFSIDGVKTEINYNNQFGAMEINASAGKHVIKGLFVETPLRLFSNLVSLVSVFGFLLYLLLRIMPKFKKI